MSFATTTTVAAFMMSDAVGIWVSPAPAIVALSMVAVAENARIPVDNPAAQFELTMVHETMALEYSGRHLAMIEFASLLKVLHYVLLIAGILAPWGLASHGEERRLPALQQIVQRSYSGHDLYTDRSRARLGRSLAVRHVDAGSCNACELELHALNNPCYDLERYGVRFVASPRHADVLSATRPVTTNMRDALHAIYEAMPSPKRVVASGDCGKDGGCFAGSYAAAGGVSAVVPVDLHIPECPPAPRVVLADFPALLDCADR